MEKKITRRDLLKALIAGSGGIVAAGFVPEKWLKPVVKSGVLPVHAQASAPEPTASPEPTPSPTPTQNFVEGNGYIDGILFAEAYVSEVPFEFPTLVTQNHNSYKLASPIKGSIPTDHPVEGVEVTLWIGTDEYPEKMITNENGYVSWTIEQENQIEFPSAVINKVTLKFVIEGDEDTFDIFLENVG